MPVSAQDGPAETALLQCLGGEFLTTLLGDDRSTVIKYRRRNSTWNLSVLTQTG